MGNDMKDMDDKPIHNINTGKSFSRIQDAIDDEETIKGHIIRVDPGTYEENVKVNKPQLTIESTSGPKDTIVKAADPTDHVFEVSGDFVTIRGFTVYGATELEGAEEESGSPRNLSGIYLHNASGCTISDNYCGYDDHKNMCGIYLTDKSTNNTIIDNTCIGNCVVGISVDGLKNNISGNTCNEDLLGICVEGEGSHHISRNTCEGNIRGIILHSCSNSNISGNTCNKNDEGISLSWGENITIAGNTLAENKKDILLRRVSNSIISRNILEICDRFGSIFFLQDSKNNTISNNTFCAPGLGAILLDETCVDKNNRIFDNTYLK